MKGYACREILSEWFFLQKTADFYRYLDAHFYNTEPIPTQGHAFLAGLEKEHKVTLITQNYAKTEKLKKLFRESFGPQITISFRTATSGGSDVEVHVVMNWPEPPKSR